jgi:hypothetical protein
MFCRIVFALFLLSPLIVAAEESNDQAVIPLHDPSRPVVVHAHLMLGSISVRGEDRKDVLVESGAERREESHPRPDGMHRIDSGGSGLDITEDNNVVTIKSGFFPHSGHISLVVPRHTSLQLKSMAGGTLSVDGVDGEIEVENMNGEIRLKDVSGSVIAHSLNGAINASFNRVDPQKPMSFSTMNGKIDVTLPDSTRANLRLKTDNGEILSDFDIKLDPRSHSVNTEGRQADGTYHIRMDKTLRGTINGGGPEYQFTSFNGEILIRKKK